MNSRNVGFPKMESRVLSWKLDIRRGISLGLIGFPIKWWNVVVLTLVDKLGTSPTSGGWQEESRDKILIELNV